MIITDQNMTRPACNTDVMDDLAIYGIARDTAKSKSAKYGPNPVFGFKDGYSSYEIQTGSAMDLAEYRVDYNIVAPDDGEFNMVVRKDVPNSLHTLTKDKLRRILTQIVEAA